MLLLIRGIKRHTKTAKMEDIFHWIRKGDAIQVRMWLDDTEHDMNQG